MRTRTCREKCSLGAPWSWDDRSWPTFPSSHRPPEKRISLGTMGHHKTPHYGISPRDGSRRGFINPFFPTVPTCAVRETASLGLHMLELSCENATVGTNGLMPPWCRQAPVSHTCDRCRMIFPSGQDDTCPATRVHLWVPANSRAMPHIYIYTHALFTPRLTYPHAEILNSKRTIILSIIAQKTV